MLNCESGCVYSSCINFSPFSLLVCYTTNSFVEENEAIKMDSFTLFLLYDPISLARTMSMVDICFTVQYIFLILFFSFVHSLFVCFAFYCIRNMLLCFLFLWFEMCAFYISCERRLFPFINSNVFWPALNQKNCALLCVCVCVCG